MTASRRAPLCLVSLTVLALPVATAAVSRVPPPWYSEVAPLLSPVEPLLAADVAPLVDPDVGGVFLLDEELRYVLPTGASGWVVHRVVRPTTQAGVEAAASASLSFLPDLQSVVLIEARTIRGDGNSVAVGEEAAFVRTPQSASPELHSDVAELTLVFPDVKPGHAVEYTVLLVQERQRIPGELSALTRMFGFWPVLRARYVLDLPAELAGRLRHVAVGPGVPPVEQSEPAPGRVRLLWEAASVPRLRWEEERQPVEQSGPAVWVTTLASWDALAAWYSGLLAERSTVPSELAGAAASWAPADASRDQVLAAYLARVAEDVRYTGLEFGLGSLQPRAPAEVWASAYGDCKDKANLLRVLLRERGITAHLALVNTEHGGRLETRAPAYHQFDHAIVAVETEDGYLFCDPTAPFLAPGQLPAGDTGRQVLVVRGERGELVEVPLQDSGAIAVEMELELRPDRSQRGWVEVVATGAVAAAFAEHVLLEDQEQRRDALARMAEGLLLAGEMIDSAVDGTRPGPGQPAVMRLFVAVPASRREGPAGDAVRLAGGDFALPDLGSERKRVTPYWQALRTRSVRVVYRLPAGWVATAALPAPLALEVPAATARARWSAEADRLVGEIRLQTRQSLVAPGEMDRYRQAVTALEAWLDAPVAVAPGEGAALAPPPADGVATELELPLMPTGEGQLRLVDFLYPPEGSLELRRRALERVLQLFPNDIPTVYQAETALAVDELGEGRAEDAARRLGAVRSRFRAQVDLEAALWSDHLLGICLQDLGRTAEAEAQFEAVAASPGAAPGRRAWAYLRLAWLAREADPDRALARLRQGIALDSEASESLFRELALLCLEQGWSQVLTDELAALAARDRLQLGAVVARLGDDAVEMVLDGDAEGVVALLRVLEEIPHDEQSQQALDDALAPVRAALASRRSGETVAAAVAETLGARPPQWWDGAATSPFPTTLADADALLEQLSSGSDAKRYLRCGLEIVSRYGSEVEDLGARLWQLASVAEDWLAPEDPLLDSFAGWLELLPTDDGYPWEGRFLRARLLAARGEAEAAVALYQGFAADPAAPPAFQVAAEISLAEAAEQRGDFDQALARLSALEGRHADNSRVVDALLRAALLDLELGREDEALRRLQALRTLPQEALDRASSADQLRELLELTADAAVARRYWSGQQRWWSSWLEVARRAELEAPPGSVVVPLLPELTEYGRRLGKAIRGGDRRGALELYRALVHGARWQPELVAEASGLTAQLARVAPELERPLRSFVIALNTELATDRAEVLELSVMNLMIQLLDEEAPERALAAARAHLDRFPDDTQVARTIARLHGLAAAKTGTELVEARAALERQLSCPDLGSDRGRAVAVLTKVLRRAGAVEDELALLKRELESNPLPPSDSQREELLARLRGLEREGLEGHAFSAAVASWLARFAPPWYDFAQPQTLADPRLRDLEKAVQDRAGDWSWEELFKLRMLVASDPAQPMALRSWAFLFGVDLVLDFEHARAETRAMLEAIIAEPRFGHAVLEDALSVALYRSALAHDRATFDWAAGLELVDSLGGGLRATAEELAPVAAVDPDDAASLVAAATRLAERPLSRRAVVALKLIWERLAELGASDQLASLAAGAEQLQVAEGSGDSALALRLHLQRLRTACDRDLAVYGPLRELVAARVDLAAASLPPGWQEPLDPDRFWLATEAEQLQLRLALLRRRTLVADGDFWESLGLAFRRERGDPTLCPALIRSVLGSAPDDDARSLAFMMQVSCLDLDQPEEREQLAELVKPYRDPQANPATFALVRFLEMSSALRRGEAVELEAALDGLHHPFITWVAPGMVTEYHLSRDDVDGLRRHLRALTPEQLLEERDLAETLGALAKAGLEAELAMVREAADKALYRATLRSWAGPAPSSLWRVFSLAEALGGGPTYPPAWLQQVERQLRDEDSLRRVRLRDAELREDWPAAATAARAILASRPTLYDLEWNVGRALARSGEVEAARAALATFVARCRSSMHLPEAEALLARLGAAVPAAPP